MWSGPDIAMPSPPTSCRICDRRAGYTGVSFIARGLRLCRGGIGRHCRTKVARRPQARSKGRRASACPSPRAGNGTAHRKRQFCPNSSKSGQKCLTTIAHSIPRTRLIKSKTEDIPHGLFEVAQWCPQDTPRLSPDWSFCSCPRLSQHLRDCLKPPGWPPA